MSVRFLCEEGCVGMSIMFVQWGRDACACVGC